MAIIVSNIVKLCFHVSLQVLHIPLRFQKLHEKLLEFMVVVVEEEVLLNYRPDYHH
jgi:hypothetical protein